MGLENQSVEKGREFVEAEAEVLILRNQTRYGSLNMKFFL